MTLIAGWGLRDPLHRWVGWLSLAVAFVGSWFAVELMTIESRLWRNVARALALSLPLVQALYGLSDWLQT
ncbi:MAG TPA: hypothetical protein VFL72_05710 [Acidimicrobiia bacterium]|nr:hypothetical protein [Acidimicrobiia bacterium]